MTTYTEILKPIASGGGTTTDLRVKLDADFAQIRTVLDINNLPVGNLWYDPFFEHPHSVGGEATKASFEDDFGFINSTDVGALNFLTTANPNEYISDELFSSVKLKVNNTSINRFDIKWTKSFLESVGFASTNELKIGFYIQAPDATVGSTRTIYVRPKSSLTWQTIVISNSTPVWIEPTEIELFNTDQFQGYEFGMRFGEAGEFFNLTGLTLKNTSTTEWLGMEDSKERLQAVKQVRLNQNIYCKYFTTEAPIVSEKLGTSDQYGADFTTDIIDITDDTTLPIKDALCAEFTSESLTRQRLNVVIGQILRSTGTAEFELLPMARDVKIKIGCWVKVEAEAGDVYTVRFQQTSEQVDVKEHAYNNLAVNEWGWVESLIVNKDACEAKILDLTIPIQIFYDYAKDSVIKVQGVTFSYIDNIHEFQYSDYIYLDRVGNFMARDYTSFGDSIVAQNNFQYYINKDLNLNHSLRGIGSTTIANTELIAWVDADGYFLDKPPSAQPPGSTEIESCMCRQERVNTIPVSTRILTILAGINDYASNIVIGNISDVASDAVGASFIASYKSMLDKIAIRCPNARIMLSTLTITADEGTQNGIGNTQHDYTIAIGDVANLYGYPVCRLDNLGVNAGNYTTYLIDTIHPNWLYGKLMGGNYVNILCDKFDNVDEGKVY